MAAKAYPKKFSASHLKGAKFARRGLRSYFEYRDLGIKRATRGGVVAPAKFRTYSIEKRAERP